MLEPHYIDTLRSLRAYYKKAEHGELQKVSAREIDDMLVGAEKYLKRIRRLFEQIAKIREQKSILDIYDTTIRMIRDALRATGMDDVAEKELLREFTSNLINKGHVPDKYLSIARELFQAKEDYDQGKLTKNEVDTVKKNSRDFVRVLVEFIQRSRGRELNRTKIRVKHGNRFGELILLDDIAFIIHDIDHEEKEISKCLVNKDGTLGKPEKSSLEEFEKYISKADIPARTFVRQQIFSDLKSFFGKDVQILVNY